MTPSILGWICIRQRSPWRFGDSDGSWSWKPSWKRKQKPFFSLFTSARQLACDFEEGTCAAWLYALLKPHVTQVLVVTRGKMPC